MILRLFCNIKRLIISLLLLSGFYASIFSQTKITAPVINDYGRVTSIGTDYVIVNDPVEFSKFEAGDTVLLIQMKGAIVYSNEDILNGTLEEVNGMPGSYEFLTVFSVDDLTKKITFRNNIIKAYDVTGDVQIVWVPPYNSAIVDAELTCAAWDSVSRTGGVLTMIVGTTLTLNADINVKGKGFLGGAIGTPGLGDCVQNNPDAYDLYAFNKDFNNAGYKGESLVSRGWLDASNKPPIFPDFAKGKGFILTGGGGGNGRFSGGGGGGNYGDGGKGGREVNTCPTPQSDGGLWGHSVTIDPETNGGIFLGGGGGGSTYLAGTPSAGGNGGGIVIILCETLDGNGYNIIADGETPSTASGNAGSGGGGGGGSIALYLQSFSASPLTISAKGGNGGNNVGTFGEGGGGGGGLITISNISVPSTVTRTISGGLVGTRLGGSSGGNGTARDNLTPFVPVLNGFLFNSIYSSVTFNQVDSICSNKSFGQISGTLPVGGTIPLTYLWEYSTISKDAGFIDAPEPNDLQNYTPPALLTQTTWFRRKITDSGTPVIEDISKAVKVIVHPFIKNNIVGKPDTVCYNGDPPLIQQLAPALADGSGRYSFIWQVSTDNSVFGSSVATTPGYDPPALLDKTSWYRRTVISGRCIDLTAVVKMTVRDTISKNIITTPPDTICHGGVFANLVTDPALGGGDGTYSYLWESSSDGSTWGTATGITNLSAYDPDELSAAFPGKEFYRRKVFSGIHNVCINTSKPVGIVDWPVITNNSIAEDQTICSSGIPVPLSGSLPLNGSGVYKYTWQDSSKVHNWLDIPGFVKVANKDFSPLSLTDSTRYKRIVYSSRCSSVSNSIVINVHKPIVNNIASLISGSDTTICSGAVPNFIKGSPPSGGTNIPGDYAYQWLYSTDNLSYWEITISGNNAGYQPVSLTSTTWFKRKVLSGKCISESNIIKIIVLSEITNNVISTDQTVCYGTTPSAITGSVLTGGAGGTPTWLWQESSDGGNTWGTAAGASSQQNYSPPALKSPIRYRRIILSGLYNCCIDTSNFVSIGIYALPAGTITSVDDITICNGTEVPLNIHLTGGSTPWKVVFSAGSSTFTFNNISVADTTIKITSSITESTANVIYSLASVQDKNNCFATSLTGSRKAIVYRVPVANAGSDNSVCGPQYTLSATPSVGAGKWIFPSQVVFSTTNDPVVTVKIDSSFTKPAVFYKFYWEETNWLCVNKDSVTITFNRRIKPVNAGSDTTIYSFDNLTQLNATPLQPGETGSWSVISGTGDFDDYNNGSTYVRNVSKGSNTYLWSVINGECKLEDLVRVDVMGLEIPQGFSPNDDPGNYNNTFVINGLDLRKKWVAPDSVPAFQHAHLSILNGAGTQVFSTTNRDGNEWKNWDGKNSKGFDLPEGTYYYLLKITSLGTGLVFKKSGFIILKRY